jgi:hypothetical protein
MHVFSSPLRFESTDSVLIETEKTRDPSESYPIR